MANAETITAKCAACGTEMGLDDGMWMALPHEEHEECPYGLMGRHTPELDAETEEGSSWELLTEIFGSEESVTRRLLDILSPDSADEIEQEVGSELDAWPAVLKDADDYTPDLCYVQAGEWLDNSDSQWSRDYHGWGQAAAINVKMHRVWDKVRLLEQMTEILDLDWDYELSPYVEQDALEWAREDFFDGDYWREEYPALDWSQWELRGRQGGWLCYPVNDDVSLAVVADLERLATHIPEIVASCEWKVALAELKARLTDRFNEVAGEIYHQAMRDLNTTMVGAFRPGETVAAAKDLVVIHDWLTANGDPSETYLDIWDEPADSLTHVRLQIFTTDGAFSREVTK